MVPSEHEEEDSLSHTFGHQVNPLPQHSRQTNPPLSSHVHDYIDSGERVPHKSSYTSPKLERPQFKVSLDTNLSSLAFPPHTESQQPQHVNLEEGNTQQQNQQQLLLYKVNSLAKQLQLEQIKSEKLQQQLKSNTSRSSVDDSTNRM